MSHNHNNNRGYTFHFAPNFPPPPLPPPIYRAPHMHYIPNLPSEAQQKQAQENADQEFVKSLEAQKVGFHQYNKSKPKVFPIHLLREEIQDLLLSLHKIELHISQLKKNINESTDEQWKSSMDEIDVQKAEMVAKLNNFVVSYGDMSKKVLLKRTTKRQRLKRLKEENKRAKQERTKQLEERSRKIDENLQKIKDNIIKAKQEEEAKLQADVVLREVSRKKQNAKKCIVKLDALLKLRSARQNTAKGRGENVSEAEAASFVNNIEKLKTLWNQKLLVYEKEEKELLEKLKEDSVVSELLCNKSEKEVKMNLALWREVLFGDSKGSPQVDFQGNINRFVSVRSQWDQHLSCDGTPLPVGWVLPSSVQ